MPIRPENRDRYPKGWPAISQRIRFERAGGRCECTGQCGIDHEDEALDLDISELAFAPEARCQAVHGEQHPVTHSKVILTVMHLNHDPEDCSEENLLAGCQRCHNRYDAPMRRAGIKARQRAAAAVGDLLDPEVPA